MSRCLFISFFLLLCFEFITSDEFNCPPLPPLTRPAQSVHELRPQDIKVVMTLGDSVTAAFAAMGRQDGIKDLYEFRGISWFIGGDPNAQTIYSFLRHYTPDIIGGSLGSHFVELCYGPICPPYQYRPKQDVFNAAQSGAMVPNLKKHEFTYLYEQLTLNPSVNMKDDWKLLSILIGFNDLCIGCSGDVPYITVDDFETNLRYIIEEVRSKIPKVFVNLVEIFNMSMIYDKSKTMPHCVDVHRLLPIECLCVFLEGKLGDDTRRDVDKYAAQYNERLRKLAKEYSEKNYQDFAVVVQPGIRDGTPENTPIDFMSDVDCFHPSLVAHQAFAKVIWNNMLTPAAKKTSNFDFKAPFVCPTNATLIYTN